MCYKTATFWKEYTISIKSFELSSLEDNTNVKSVDYWLKYHRMLKNISQNDLAIKVGFKSGSCIKDIEMNRKYPGREISQNLTQYFNLSTKYFYDEYLEDTDELRENLINYRKNNDLNIKEAAKLIGVDGNTW